MSGFLIKSFHSIGGPPRLFFWQTPLVVDCPPYIATNDYGETVTRTSREVGGWMTFSGAGTVYPTQEEAEAVSCGRRLFGDVVPADRYLQSKA
jgi:hypothetical protein